VYSLSGLVTLPSRFHLGIVSGGEMSRLYTVGLVNCLLIVLWTVDFRFEVSDLFLDMTSV